MAKLDWDDYCQLDDVVNTDELPLSSSIAIPLNENGDPQQLPNANAEHSTPIDETHRGNLNKIYNCSETKKCKKIMMSLLIIQQILLVLVSLLVVYFALFAGGKCGEPTASHNSNDDASSSGIGKQSASGKLSCTDSNDKQTSTNASGCLSNDFPELNFLRAAQQCPDCARILFHNKSYLIPTSKANWTAADAYCKDLRGNLVTVKSSEVNKILKTLVQYYNLKEIWIGLIFAPSTSTDLQTCNHSNYENMQKQWKWSSSNNELVDYVNWASSKSDGCGSNAENCVQILPTDDMVWYDVRCELNIRFICEF